MKTLIILVTIFISIGTYSNECKDRQLDLIISSVINDNYQSDLFKMIEDRIILLNCIEVAQSVADLNASEASLEDLRLFLDTEFRDESLWLQRHIHDLELAIEQKDPDNEREIEEVKELIEELDELRQFHSFYISKIYYLLSGKN